MLKCILSLIWKVLKSMKVYAFIGSSGTGKSYKAFMVAKDRDIDYIIDDGLLIGGTRIIAGKSAKKESTRIAAVRRALFVEDAHKIAVREAIEDTKPDKVLVLGTSRKMIDQIVEALGLPEISETIMIEHVATEKEIDAARKSRKVEGKHVIPAPTVEVKRSFSGYFIDTLRVFRKRDRNTMVAERTVVRPTFSYLGRYEIATPALLQLISHCASKVDGILKVLDARVDNQQIGIAIDIEVEIVLSKRLDIMLKEVQKKVVQDIEYMTGLNVLAVNIKATRIELKSGSIML